MRMLIVNADDFGGSSGINRGIIESHCTGVVTSTSLMVDMPAAIEAAALTRAHATLDVGLHVQLTDERYNFLVDVDSPKACRREIRRQFDRCCALLQRAPTHLDSHHNIHRDPRLLPHFLELASDYRIPLRMYCGVRHFGDFYGQWDDGQSHPEWISAANFISLVQAEVGDTPTEFSCHPGYVDDGLDSDYGVEREVEVQTLCDPSVRRQLAELNVRLMRFSDIVTV
jgi:chitin disaccharide deacetylase